VDLATPEAWTDDAELVRRFYDMRRELVETVTPNPGHTALARLQAAWGPDRCFLVTQNIDGLLGLAGAEEVVEMHGSLRRLKCERSDACPRVEVQGRQDPAARCRDCGGRLRPDVVWFGEMPYAMELIYDRLAACTVFISVGTSGVVYPAAGFCAGANSVGATCIEINPDPAGGPFRYVLTEGSESALPRLVSDWITT
jgi:NAD-dependent deacetylase